MIVKMKTGITVYEIRMKLQQFSIEPLLDLVSNQLFFVKLIVHSFVNMWF